MPRYAKRRVVRRPRAYGRIKGRGAYKANYFRGLGSALGGSAGGFAGENVANIVPLLAGLTALGAGGPALGAAVAGGLGELGGFAKPMAKAGGSYAGRKIGGAVGGGVDWLAGKVSKLFGRGDYRVSGEQHMRSFQNMPPTFSNADDSVIFSHCEYIMDVVPSTNGTFATNYIDFNPGQMSVLPIGSSIMCNFDKYELLGCVYFYRSMSADALNSVNGALGTVILSVDSDVMNNCYRSKTAQECMSGSISVKPSENCCIAVECKPSMQVTKELYNIPGNAPMSLAGYLTADSSQQDARFTYHHRMQVSSQGLQTTTASPIGEIWCAYRIRCVSIQPCVPLGKTILRAHYEAGSTATTSAYFGTLQASNWVVNANAPLIQAYDNIGLSFTNTVLSFPTTYGAQNAYGQPGATLTYPFFFKFMYWYNCTSGTNNLPTITVDGTNIKTVSEWYNSATAAQGPNANNLHSTPTGTNSTIMAVQSLVAVAPGGTITFSGGTLTTTVSAAIFTIDQWNGPSELPNNAASD